MIWPYYFSSVLLDFSLYYTVCLVAITETTFSFSLSILFTAVKYHKTITKNIEEKEINKEKVILATSVIVLNWYRDSP